MNQKVESMYEEEEESTKAGVNVDKWRSTKSITLKQIFQVYVAISQIFLQLVEFFSQINNLK